MYKYDINIDDWDQPLSYIVNKVFKYNTGHIIINNVFSNARSVSLLSYSHVELKDWTFDCHCIIVFGC